jgi:hypothetical protein
MKNTILIAFLTLLNNSGSAQDVHFRGLNSSTKHLVAVSAGADYSVYYGGAYGYVLKNALTPVIIGTEFTLPFGTTMIDDWKWRTGLQAELWKSRNFSLALKPAFVLRRYASPLSRMYNLGADLTLTFGYVRPKWGIVALAGFDKSVSTHIRHDELSHFYPGIRDGWYKGAGGNFKFGARANVSAGKWTAFLQVGKHFGQNFRDNPTLPFFGELSIQRQLGK